MSAPDPFVAVDDLDPAATLARAGAVTLAQRAAEIEDLELSAHWADLHGHDPRDAPGPHPPGSSQLVEIGGDGTPLVQDLCLPELAIARGVHTMSARAHMADALDLRHRLPRVWTVARDLDCPTWLARRVARMSRHLDQFQVVLVDEAVAEALRSESPGRVLTITEAKIIEADLVGHRERVAAELRKRYVRLGRTDEHGLRHVIARVEASDAVWLDALVHQVAERLAARRDLVPDLPETATVDELRAVALGWLAHPHDVVKLLADDPGPISDDHRRHVDLHVHLNQAAVESGAGVARVEEIGPLLLDQVHRLLGHARVTVKPVIDLNSGASVNSYEHPEAVRERTLLRNLGDVFPHATTLSRRVDLDHPNPYQRHGPPGQTGDHNAAPLSRTHHRAKTHLGYTVIQVGPDDYVWRTPHGLLRRVNAAGTHEIDLAQATDLVDPGRIDRAVASVRVPGP